MSVGGQISHPLFHPPDFKHSIVFNTVHDDLHARSQKLQLTCLLIEIKNQITYISNMNFNQRFNKVNCVCSLNVFTFNKYLKKLEISREDISLELNR